MRREFRFLCFFVFSASLTAAAQCLRDKQWAQYKYTYRKKYASLAEEKNRRKIWEDNMMFIEKHNAAAAFGKYTFKMGMNIHGDKTDKEITQMYLGGYSNTLVSSSTHKPHRREPVNSVLRGCPRFVDWRRRGCNLVAHDQQPCGSCTLFATMATIECHKAYKSRRSPRRLSVQHIIDCVADRKSYMIAGCLGNMPEGVLLYLLMGSNREGAIASSCYPYTGKDTGYSCNKTRVKSCDYKVPISGMEVKYYPEEHELQNMVNKKGPVIVGMAVVPSTFRFYKSGIYSDPMCSKYDINHSVAIFGYGENYRRFGQDNRYWLVKNSFGSSWGFDGFVKMTRNNNRNCHLEEEVVFPKM